MTEKGMREGGGSKREDRRVKVEVQNKKESLYYYVLQY